MLVEQSGELPLRIFTRELGGAETTAGRRLPFIGGRGRGDTLDHHGAGDCVAADHDVFGPAQAGHEFAALDLVDNLDPLAVTLGNACPNQPLQIAVGDIHLARSGQQAHHKQPGDTRRNQVPDQVGVAAFAISRTCGEFVFLRHHAVCGQRGGR